MFNNFSIKGKLITGFLYVALIAVIIGVLGIHNTTSLTNNIEEIGNVRLPSIVSLEEIRVGVNAIWVGERGLTNRRMNDLRQAQYKYIQDSWKMINDGWAIYEPLPQT